MNGNETPVSSFKKYTSRRILEELQAFNMKFESSLNSRTYQIWQEKPHFIEVKSLDFFFQKLDYIHQNPVQAKWMLVDEPINYQYSSMRFYENEVDEFGFLTHINGRL